MANSTDKSILTAAGKALLAQLNAEEKALVIDKMIFANVPNRPEYPQPDDVVPTDHIVHQEQVEQRGRLSADSVIYSTTLTSDVGPFDFNWTGAYCSEYGVLVTIDHHALTPKTADEPGVAGNTLVRSVVLEYKDIAEITNITVDASSWQYNATERMKKMDSDVAQSIIDQNGKDWFIEDGFLVTPSGSAYSIKAGAGYVSGNRVAMEFDRSVQVPNKPSFIYIDAHREGTPTGEQVTLFDFIVTPEVKEDYIGLNGIKHYVCAVAAILSDGVIRDLRPKGNSASKEYVEDIAGKPWRQGEYVTDNTDIRIFKSKGNLSVSVYAPNASKETPVLMGDELGSEWRIVNDAKIPFCHDLEYEPASVGFRLKNSIYVTDAPFLADKSGKEPARKNIQLAMDECERRGGGIVFVPPGKYLWDEVSLIPRANVTLVACNWKSEFVVTTDMECIAFYAQSEKDNIFNFWLKNIKINNVYEGKRTKYDIHIQNPNFCKFTRIHCKSAHNDSYYSDSDVSGIWLERPKSSNTTAFCNLLEDCWFQSASAWFDNLTDSAIKGGWYWGHTREFSIRTSNGGANAFEGIKGIIPSKFKGGIWIDGEVTNQLRIIGNGFDGNPAVDTGHGVYSPQQTISVIGTGNTFWGCGKRGVHTVDPVGWVFTANNFWKCNSDDNSWDDITIIGENIQPNGNVFSDNTHVIDDVRNNPGYAIKEANLGSDPTLNTYSGNGVLGSYKEGGIKTLLDSTVWGNSGCGAQYLNTVPGLKMNKSTNIFTVTKNVPPNSFLDIPVSTNMEFGVPAGFCGFLSINSVRGDYYHQNAKSTHAIVASGSQFNINDLAEMKKENSAEAYTISMPANGILRVSNNINHECIITVQLVGINTLS